MTAPCGPAPRIPNGFQVSWSDEHSQWYYMNLTTGATQWEYPSSPSDAGLSTAALQPNPSSPIPPQYAQQPLAQTLGAPQTEGTTTRGIGSMVTGAFLAHEIHEHSNKPHFPNFGGSNHGLGSVTTLLESAGVGALGAKLFGGKGQTAQPTPQTYPVQTQRPQPYYNQYPPQGNPSSAPGFGGQGNFAAGGAAGMAGTFAATNLQHHNSYQGGTAPALGGSSTYGSNLSSATHSGPPLFIYAAVFADKNVTERVRALVKSEQTITIKDLVEQFGDPWPEMERKSFNVMYRYGDRPPEVWAGSTSVAVVDIRNEPLANARMAYINKNPGRIVALIWGQESVLSEERIAKLERDGEMDARDLGEGDFYNFQTKSLTCYYRDEHGGVGTAQARQGGTLRLPWNPLAKWS